VMCCPFSATIATDGNFHAFQVRPITPPGQTNGLARNGGRWSPGLMLAIITFPPLPMHCRTLDLVRAVLAEPGFGGVRHRSQHTVVRSHVSPRIAWIEKGCPRNRAVASGVICFNFASRRSLMRRLRSRMP